MICLGPEAARSLACGRAFYSGPCDNKIESPAAFYGEIKKHVWLTGKLRRATRSLGGLSPKRESSRAERQSATEIRAEDFYEESLVSAQFRSYTPIPERATKTARNQISYHPEHNYPNYSLPSSPATKAPRNRRRRLFAMTAFEKRRDFSDEDVSSAEALTREVPNRSI